MLINNLVRVIFMFLCISATASPTPTLNISRAEGFKAKKIGMFSMSEFELKLCVFVASVAPTFLHNRPQTVYEFMQLCNRNYELNDHNSGWKRYLVSTPSETASGCFNTMAVDVVYSAFKELGVHEQYNICFCLSLYVFMSKIDRYSAINSQGNILDASQREQDALKVWFIQELLKYSCSHFIADSEECLYQRFYYFVKEALLNRYDDSFTDGRYYVYNVLTTKFVKSSSRRRGNNGMSLKHKFDYFELMSICLSFQFYNMYGEHASRNYRGSDAVKVRCLLIILHLDSKTTFR